MNSLRWILQQVFGGRRIRPELLAEDVEWVNPHDAIEPGTRRGADCFNRRLALCSPPGTTFVLTPNA